MLRSSGLTQPPPPVDAAVARTIGASLPRRACAWLPGFNARRGPPDADAETRRRRVERLLALAPEIGSARQALVHFIAMTCSRDAAALDRWLAQPRTSAVGEVRRFAASLGQNLLAVRAAVSSAWGSGQVEDQIIRLKMIKRQLYRRAKLDLLRICMLARG